MERYEEHVESSKVGHCQAAFYILSNLNDKKRFLPVCFSTDLQQILIGIEEANAKSYHLRCLVNHKITQIPTVL